MSGLAMVSAMATPMSRVLAVPGPSVPALLVTAFATFMTCRSLSVIAAPTVLGMLALPVLPAIPALGKFVPFVVPVASPFVPALTVTPFAAFVTRHSLAVIAAPAVLGMLASPVVSALSKFASANLLALGIFISAFVPVPSAARPQLVIGLFAMSTPIVAAFFVVPPIAFVARIATINCSRLATVNCSRLATVVRGAIATVVRQFVRSDLVARRQTPVKTSRKLHQDGSCKSSHKHQHAISHPTAPSPDSRRGFSRG